MQETEKRLYVQLNQLYPEGEVIGLFEKNPDLYYEIRRYGLEKGMKPQEVIQHLGFRFVRKNNPKHQFLQNQELYVQTLQELKEAMLSLYPNQHLPPLREVKKQHPQFAYKPFKLAKSEGKTEKQFWESLGFQVGEQKRKYPIDPLCLTKLYQEFHCNLAKDFADLLGVSRQYLSALVNHLPKRTPKESWDFPFTAEDTQTVLPVIQERIFAYDDKDTIVRIYKHKQNPLEFAVFLKRNGTLKCLFELPLIIKQELLAKQFHRFDEKDFQIIKAIEAKGITAGEPLQLKEEYEEISHLISLRMQTGKWPSKKEYISFIGWTYMDARMLTDEDIRNRITPYIDEHGYFRMSVQDEGYHALKNLFSNRGFRSTEEGISYFGFKYKRTRSSTSTAEKYKEILRHFVVHDNKVYIQTVANAGFYQLILFYGKRCGMTFNETLQFLGYERVMKEELPEDFVPYVWRPQLAPNPMIEDFQDVLDEFVIDDETREVLLQEDNPLYQMLANLSQKQNKTLIELLEEWGYILFQQPSDEDTMEDVRAETSGAKAALAAEQEDPLWYLKSVQGSLERTTVQSEKIQRSRELVQEIKKLYNYRCQICAHDGNGETIPYIVKNDGTHYVEVHHIIALSDADLTTADFELDSYKNVICVCAHHHRMLHFHQGGYNTFCSDGDDNLFFISEQGDVLQVRHNLHLRPEMWV